MRSVFPASISFCMASNVEVFPMIPGCTKRGFSAFDFSLVCAWARIGVTAITAIIIAFLCNIIILLFMKDFACKFVYSYHHFLKFVGTGFSRKRMCIVGICLCLGYTARFFYGFDQVY